MAYRLKMYGRFVLWLLKNSVTFGGFIPEFFAAWKDSVRSSFGASVALYLVLSIVTLATSSLIGYAEAKINEQPKIEFLLYPFVLVTLLYFGVIISALYDIFLEDYERSFTILKNNSED